MVRVRKASWVNVVVTAAIMNAYDLTFGIIWERKGAKYPSKERRVNEPKLTISLG